MGKIGHIILNISNLERSRIFYDKLMGLLGFKMEHEYTYENDPVTMLSYRSGEHNIWIRQDRNSTPASFVRNPGLDHIAFYAESKAKVDAIYQELKTDGILITREPRSYPEYSENYYAFYLRDPDGIPLEVYVE